MTSAVDLSTARHLRTDNKLEVEQMLIWKITTGSIAESMASKDLASFIPSSICSVSLLVPNGVMNGQDSMTKSISRHGVDELRLSTVSIHPASFPESFRAS